MKTNGFLIALYLLPAVFVAGAPAAVADSKMTGMETVPVAPPTFSVTLTGEVMAFQKEPGEQAIDGPVFLRSTTVTTEISSGCGTSTPTVNILAKDGTMVAGNLPVSTAFGATGVLAAKWTIPGTAQVGEYSVQVTCGSKTVQKKFYVIFDPAVTGNYPQFTYQNEKIIWFDCPNDETARPCYYALHPDDFRVFKRAIAATQGKTTVKDAAHAIARAEELLFDYGTVHPSLYGYDVTALLSYWLNKKVQCADDAAILVAMLRAVGIVAYTVTADANIGKNPPFNWTFDTWVEFLEPGLSGAQPWVLHPHQYPNTLAQSRALFGNTQPVALRAVNDIILIADFSLTAPPSGVLPNVLFGRQNCDEPTQTFITKPSWVTERCEEYWKPARHWDCGVTPDTLMVPPLTADRWGRVNTPGSRFKVDSTKVRYDNRFPGTFTLQVPNTAPAGSFWLVLRLMADAPRSKAFGDAILDSLKLPIQVQAGKTIFQSFEFYLPPSLPARYENIFLTASLEKDDSTSPYPRFFVVEQFFLPKPLITHIQLDSVLVESKKQKVKVELQNSGTETIRNIEARILLLYPLTLIGKETQVIDALQPNERKSVEFEICSQTAPDVGAVEIAVVSRNGGSRQEFVVSKVIPDGSKKTAVKKRWLFFKRK